MKIYNKNGSFEWNSCTDWQRQLQTLNNIVVICIAFFPSATCRKIKKTLQRNIIKIYMYVTCDTIVANRWAMCCGEIREWWNQRSHSKFWKYACRDWYIWDITYSILTLSPNILEFSQLWLCYASWPRDDHLTYVRGRYNQKGTFSQSISSTSKGEIMEESYVLIYL